MRHSLVRGVLLNEDHTAADDNSQLEMVELGVVGCFIDLLSSPNQRLQFYAITALRNLSTFHGNPLRQSGVCSHNREKISWSAHQLFP